MNEQMALQLDKLERVEVKEDLHVEEMPVDSSGLITAIKWRTKASHGSFLVDEPYRSPKSTAELKEMTLRHLKTAKK